MPKRPTRHLDLSRVPTDKTFYPSNYKRPKVNLAHHNIQKAFKAIGGWRALADWGRQNPTEFYKLWSKLLPREILVEADITGDIGDGNVTLVIEGVPSRYDIERYRELIGDDLPAEYREVEPDEAAGDDDGE